uniref:SIS domain-containing protein n=1 Tax=Streptomyces sp. NBC_01401 TaxID=2903854 RepID=A0AAU3H266_9ACTN
MDAVRVALLREVLAGTEWPAAAREFARTLRSSVVPHGGGLLLVGTEAYEPWHLAAHLVDESTWSGLPQLRPTLVRHRVEPDDPVHLAVGLGRIEAAGRGETLLVVAPGQPADGLLERVHDARRAGATVLALDGGGDPEVRGLAHEALTVRDGDEVDLDTVQHLVSAAAGENCAPSPRGRRTFRDRLSRLADQLTAPPPARW